MSRVGTRRRGATATGAERKAARSSVKVWAKDDWKRMSGKASKDSYVCPDVDAFDAQLRLESQRTTSQSGGYGNGEGKVLSLSQLTALKKSVDDVISALATHWTAKDMEKEKRKCAEAISELINTEIDYVRDLRLVTSVFLSPIRDQEILNKYEIVSLFSNIEALIISNTAVAEKLAAALSDGGNVLQGTGKAMKDAATSLGATYSVYCANQPNIPTRLREYQEDDKLKQFLKGCLQAKECRKLGLEDFLIMPLQRLCKYPLLLKQILASVPKSMTMDYISVAESLTCINKAVDHVNGRVKQVENVTKLVEIALSLKNKDEYREKITNSPSREFVLEADVLLGDKPRHLFLFSDSLLLCKRVRESSASAKPSDDKATPSPYIAFRLIPVAMMVVTDLKDTEDGNQSSFELAEMGRKLYIVQCKNRQQKRLWLGKLQQAISSLGSATEAEKRSSVKALRQLQLKGESLVKHQELLVPSSPTENKSPGRLHRRSMWLASKITGSSSGLASGSVDGSGGLQKEVTKLQTKNELLKMQLDAANVKARAASDVLSSDAKKAAKLAESEKQREEDLERIVELEEKVEELQEMINAMTKSSVKLQKKARKHKRRAKDYKRKYLALHKERQASSLSGKEDDSPEEDDEFSEDSSSE